MIFWQESGCTFERLQREGEGEGGEGWEGGLERISRKVRDQILA